MIQIYRGRVRDREADRQTDRKSGEEKRKSVKDKVLRQKRDGGRH